MLGSSMQQQSLRTMQWQCDCPYKCRERRHRQQKHCSPSYSTLANSRNIQQSLAPHLATMAEGSGRSPLATFVSMPVMMDAPRSMGALKPLPVWLCTRPPTLSRASKTTVSTPQRCTHQQQPAISETSGDISKL